MVLYEENSEEAWDVCEVCHGARLNPTSLAVRLGRHSIADVAALPVERVGQVLGKLRFAAHSEAVARGLVAEVRSRLEFLELVGVPYLGLDRAANTLSGGEAQRVRLAAQLGSNLRGVCYILDEPTIGLHPRDTTRLIGTLRRLRDRGNTVVVVEHDEHTIRSADHVIDLGPGAGRHGGEVIAAGTVAKLMKSKRSLTARYLKKPLRHEPRSTDGSRITGRSPSSARASTTSKISPCGSRSVGSFASRASRGSGKSSLVQDVLFDGLRLVHAGRRVRRDRCARIEGASQVARALEVDQTPIGRTPRSTPATYVGFYDEIRAPVRADARGAAARLHGVALLVQRQGRPLREMPGAGAAQGRDELPAERARGL